MEFSRSFRLSRSQQRILLSSESVTSECTRIAGSYERLSKSMRLSGEYDFSDQQHKKHNKRGFGFLNKVLSLTRNSNPHEGPHVAAEAATATKKEKKRSSWLPDPHRRWPIQGWWLVFFLLLFFLLCLNSFSLLRICINLEFIFDFVYLFCLIDVNILLDWWKMILVKEIVKNYLCYAFVVKLLLTIQDLCFDQFFNQCISEVVTVLTYCYGLRERC